jgi:hypothetical protein
MDDVELLQIGLAEIANSANDGPNGLERRAPATIVKLLEIGIREVGVPGN